MFILSFGEKQISTLKKKINASNVLIVGAKYTETAQMFYVCGRWV